jgi:hypothetical protein
VRGPISSGPGVSPSTWWPFVIANLVALAAVVTVYTAVMGFVVGRAR